MRKHGPNQATEAGPITAFGIREQNRQIEITVTGRVVSQRTTSKRWNPSRTPVAIYQSATLNKFQSKSVGPPMNMTLTWTRCAIISIVRHLQLIVSLDLPGCGRVHESPVLPPTTPNLRPMGDAASVDLENSTVVGSTLKREASLNCKASEPAIEDGWLRWTR